MEISYCFRADCVFDLLMFFKIQKSKVKSKKDYLH